MDTRTFRDRLAPLKARTAERRGPRPPFVSRALRAFSLLETTEHELLPFLNALRDEIPELAPTRRPFDGAYVLGVEADVPHGRFKGKPYLAYNRLSFSIRPDGDNGRVQVTCRTTVMDRDGETLRRVVEANDEGWESLRAFVESCCLGFATTWFRAAA